jgi:hypothetical protein
MPGTPAGRLLSIIIAGRQSNSHCATEPSTRIVTTPAAHPAVVAYSLLGAPEISGQDAGIQEADPLLVGLLRDSHVEIAFAARDVWEETLRLAQPHGPDLAQWPRPTGAGSCHCRRSRGIGRRG